MAFQKSEAELNGFDEAIVLTAGGHVNEASAANVFVVRDGVMLTPPVSDDLLEGVTRKAIMEILANEGIPVEVRSIDRSELYVADEMLLCGTGVQVSPVIEVDHRPVGAGTIGPIAASRERALFRRRSRARARIPALADAHRVTVPGRTLEIAGAPAAGTLPAGDSAQRGRLEVGRVVTDRDDDVGAHSRVRRERDGHAEPLLQVGDGVREPRLGAVVDHDLRVGRDRAGRPLARRRRRQTLGLEISGDEPAPVGLVVPLRTQIWAPSSASFWRCASSDAVRRRRG